jgi:hypothetical protein
MTRTITAPVAFSVFLSFFVWMSVLSTRTDAARYGSGFGIFHHPLLNNGAPEDGLR